MCNQDRRTLLSSSVNEFPRVSIITAVYNGMPGIQRAFDCLVRQNYEGEIEHIVVDGGSTDGTLEFLKSEKNRISVLISEKDRGIADAWNKGLRFSTGDIIATLNHDDFYAKDAIHEGVRVLNPEKLEISYGTAHMIDPRSGSLVNVREGQFNPGSITDGFGFMHTTCFTTRPVFRRVGYFKTRYRIAVDTDFLLRSISAGTVFKKCHSRTYMSLGGLSDRKELQAFFEFSLQLWRQGYPKQDIIRSLLKRTLSHITLGLKRSRIRDD